MMMHSAIHSRSAGKAAKLARRSSKHFGSQPDALGLATRLAAERLREAGIGREMEFGAKTDQIIFDKRTAQLRFVGADPYLNEGLLHYCEQALAQRHSNVSSLRVSVENAITPPLPHGKARLDAVARKLGMSNPDVGAKADGRKA